MGIEALLTSQVIGLDAALTGKLSTTGGTLTGALAITQGTANASVLTSTGYSLTGSNAQSLVNLAGTWNTSGTPTAFKLNITDTASNASSLLMDLQVGGSSKFKVTKTGSIVGPAISATQSTFGFSSDTGLCYNSSVLFMTLQGADQAAFSAGIVTRDQIRFSTSPSAVTADCVLVRDAANTLAQRNSTSAQTFRLYNTYTSATSYERGKLEWDTNVLKIGTEKGSAGGSARDLELQTDGTTRFRIVNNVTAGRVLVMDSNGNLSGSGYGLSVTGTFIGSMLASANSGMAAMGSNNSTVSVAGGSSINGTLGSLLKMHGLHHASGGIFTLAGAALTEDYLTGTCSIKASDAWASATTNITGGSLTIGGGSSGGSNSTGGTVTIFGGQSRGTGLGGSIVLQTAAAGAAGSSLNAVVTRLTVDSTGLTTFSDACNIAVGTTTGTKIGTATSQKIGFYDKTPVVQPTAVADATDAASVITQLNALLSRMRDLGLIAT